jgi:hypothetical protein
MTTGLAPSSAQLASTGRPRRVASRILLGLPALAVGAFGGQLLATGWTTERGDGAHHVADLAWGTMEAVLLLVPLLVALRRPSRRPAALMQALAVVGALLVAMVLVAEPDPFTIVLGTLVLAGVLMAPGRLPRPAGADPVLGGLCVLAAMGLAPYVLRAAADQRAGTDVHAELLGYTGAVAWALALLAVLAVASLRMAGWQVPAACAAVAAAVIGVASLIWPDDAVSLGAAGGAALVGFAVAVSLTTIARSRRER